MFAVLTDLAGDGSSWGLPVVDTKELGHGHATAYGKYPRTVDGMWTVAEQNAIGLAPFVEVDYDKATLAVTGFSDDFTNGTVTRTYTTEFYPIADLKFGKTTAADNKRVVVAKNGITHLGKPVGTDSTSLEDINLIFNMLNAGETFPGNSIPWPTLDGQVLNVTEAQFLGFAKAVAQHRVKTTKAYRAHIDAIAALSDAQTIVDYNVDADIVGSEWPVNP